MLGYRPVLALPAGPMVGQGVTMFEAVARKLDVEGMFEDLLEGAFLDALVSGQQQALAYLWLQSNPQRLH